MCLLFQFPGVKRGEPGVGMGRHFVDYGKIHAVGNADGLTEYLASTYNEHFRFVPACLQGLVDGIVYLCTCQRCNGAAYNDVASARQCAAGKRLEGGASHNDGMPHGQRLETLHVGRYVEEQLVAIAYCPVAVYYGDYVYHVMFLEGC